MVDGPKPAVRYSDPSHAALNARRELSAHPAPFDGPWLKPDTLLRLPNLARDFQRSRDPLVAKQVDDLEAGGDRSGRGSTSPMNEEPKPELKPPPHMRLGVPSPNFGQGGLSAQRDADFDAAARPVPSPRSIDQTQDQSKLYRSQIPSR